MNMVRLHLSASNRHLFPLVILWLLVMLIGNPSGIFQCDAWSAIEGEAVLVIMALAGYYSLWAASTFAYLNSSDFGESLFGWRFDRRVIMTFLVRFGVLFTYLIFVCRVTLMSAVEAIFIGILFTAATGNRFNLFDDPLRGVYWWVILSAILASLHTWVERSNLGEAALEYLDDKNENRGRVASSGYPPETFTDPNVRN